MRSVSSLLLSLFVFLSSGELFAQTLPELPRETVDTRHSPPSGGRTWSVRSGGNLQNALNEAQPGDIIELEAGAVFTGNFLLPQKTGDGWIYIRSSAHASLPVPGDRVGPAHASLMPKITAPDGNVAALATAYGAHHYRLVGIELTTASSRLVSVVLMGFSGIYADRRAASLDELPHHIIFDRCYIHGNPTGRIRRGIYADGRHVGVVDSYLSDFHDSSDSQTMIVINGAGPYKIANNFLEASGENIMFGGGDAAIANLTPSDIEIRGNYFYKPLAWRVGDHCNIKNLFELKHAQRVLVIGNIMENNWADAQTGSAVLFTVRNQDGSNPWAVVRDVSFTKNIIKNTAQGFNITNRDNNHTTQETERILIQNNLMHNVNGEYLAGGAAGRFISIGYAGGVPGRNLIINHNTLLHTGSASGAVALGDGEQTIFDGVSFQNNLFTHGNYGVFGSNVGSGTSGLNSYLSNYSFIKNAIISRSGDRDHGNDLSSRYPTNNWFPIEVSGVGFRNYAGGDFRLSDSSQYKNSGTDGKDVGADIEAINILTACVFSGICSNIDNDSPAAPSGLRFK